MGFTGFRKMLLVSWSIQCIKDTKPDKKEPSTDEICKFLNARIRFSDEAQKPSERVVKELQKLCSSYMTNPRCMAAYTRCEMIWGRNTTFDDYTKLSLLVQRAAGPHDLAFMTEWVALHHLQQETREACEPLSKNEISSKPGLISTALVSKSAITFLKSMAPASWKKHDIFAQICSPLGCFDCMMSPTGGPPPEHSRTDPVGETATWQEAQKKLSLAPPSLRICALIIKQIFTRDSKIRAGIRGLLGNGCTTIDEFPSFFERNVSEEWKDFKGALLAERPPPAPGEADVDGQASASGGGQAPLAPGAASAGSGDAPPESVPDRAAVVAKVPGTIAPPAAGTAPPAPQPALPHPPSSWRNQTCTVRGR